MRPSRWFCRPPSDASGIEKQRELSPGQWDLTFTEIDMKGRALFFKNIAVQEREHRSDFRMVPDDLTLAEAAQILTRQVIVAANR